MPFMYILLCTDGSYYTGSSWEINRRLDEHQSGMGSEYTKNRLPIKLIFAEEYDLIEDAYRREWQIPEWSSMSKTG